MIDLERLDKLLGRLMYKTAGEKELIEKYSLEVLEEAVSRKFVEHDFFRVYALTDAGMAAFNSRKFAARKPAPPSPTPSTPTLEPKQESEPERTLKVYSAYVTALNKMHPPRPELESAPVAVAKEENMNQAIEEPKPHAGGRLRAEILKFMGSDPLTIVEIADRLGTKPTNINVILKSLADSGQVHRTGLGKPGDPFRYAEFIPSVTIPSPIQRPPVLEKPIAGIEASVVIMDEEPSIPAWSEPLQYPVEHHGMWNASSLIENIQARVSKPDPELEAMKSIIDALEPLDLAVQDRIMQWVGKRLGLT